MTVDEMLEIYNDYAENSGFKDFDNLPDDQKLHHRQDLNAFLTLDKIYSRIPSNNKAQDILQCAEHDTIYLSNDLDNIAEVITKEEIIILAMSGVSFNEDDGLYMFV